MSSWHSLPTKVNPHTFQSNPLQQIQEFQSNVFGPWNIHPACRSICWPRTGKIMDPKVWGGCILQSCLDCARWWLTTPLPTNNLNIQLTQHPWHSGTFHERTQYFLKTWICGFGSTVTYTPRGSAANINDPTQGATQAAAFLASLYGNYVAPSNKAKSRKYLCWARSQTRWEFAPPPLLPYFGNEVGGLSFCNQTTSKLLLYQ